MPINESDTKWVYRDDYYCPGSNMDPIKHPELYEHQCFAKCLRDEECVGDGHQERWVPPRGIIWQGVVFEPT